MRMLYLLSLLAAIGSFLAIDRRWKLAFFAQARRTMLTIALAMPLFIAWDLLGVGLGIFFEGGSPYMTGVFLLPHFPLEELFFLFLLTYMPLVLYRWGETWRRT